jgi:hypothetical protein
VWQGRWWWGQFSHFPRNKINSKCYLHCYVYKCLLVYENDWMILWWDATTTK